MLRALLVFGILIPGIVLALGSPFGALLLYLWFAFFRPEAYLWFDITPLRISLVLGLILVIRSLVSGIVPNLSHPLSIGMGLFLTSGLLAQMNAVDPTVGWMWLDYFTRVTLVCLLAVSLIETPRDLMRAMAVTAGSLGFFTAKAGLASLLEGGVQFAAGLAGSFIDNNGYAVASAMTIPLIIAVGQNGRLVWDRELSAATMRLFRLGCFALVPLCAYMVISTFSRGGLLALLAIAAAFVILHPRRFRIAVGAVVVAAIAYLVVPLPSGYLDRIDSIRTDPEEMDTSMRGRLHFWRVAVDMAFAQPLGIGLRNFELAYDQYDSSGGAFGRRRAVHSSHFQVLAETGFVGLAVWVLQFAYAFRLTFLVRRRSRAPGLSAEASQFLTTVSSALALSMVGFVVGGATISLAMNDLTWVTFALVAALDRLSARMGAEAEVPAQTAAPAIPRIQLPERAAR